MSLFMTVSPPGGVGCRWRQTWDGRDQGQIHLWPEKPPNKIRNSNILRARYVCLATLPSRHDVIETNANACTLEVTSR
ncbi:hypothetical protein RRG08_015905 [Elysia crispata]|uniref:Uncharacterized protein n=1 Tax=Elysia crispata TaxID=231223 RepID=A0AAE1ANI8_9GAST|nr:hypothetical protein RRG08_015905 [Elysia crispata]